MNSVLRNIHCLVALLSGFAFYAQKSRIIDPSGFTHNYAVSGLQYLEDLVDTTRLKYIASLNISGSGEEAQSFPFLGLIQIKAKELGANCYYLLGYSEQNGSVSITVKLFFAGLSVLETNKKKYLKNTVFIMNVFEQDSLCFYVNKEKKLLNRKQVYTIPLAVKQECTIAANEKEVTGKTVVFKKEKPARFFVAPLTNKTILLGGGPIVVSGLNVAASVNKLYEMDYDSGRLRLELYK